MHTLPIACDMSDKKVLVVGLDSATWLTLGPLLARGVMPKLRALREGGCSGVLRSTNPPITSSGWTAMITGVNPSRHGIVGFERYDLEHNRLCFSNSQDVQAETMWQYLGQRGYKAAALNVPMHYPPYPINGVMTSGYGCPGMQAEITYPKELKEIILKQIPDYNILMKWKVDETDPETFGQVVSACRRSFEHSYELAELVTEKYGWDVMMVISHQLDAMQHKLMGYMLPAGWEKWPRQAEGIFDIFGHLDEIIGKLATLANGEDDLVMVTSDHGQGPRYGRVRPNTMLREWGYLKQEGSFNRACRRMSEQIWSLFGRHRRRGTKRVFSAGPMDVVEMLRLDWPKTRAVAAFRAQHMFVFLNVKGRQPDGLVEPGEEYNKLIEELRERFSQVRDTQRNEPVFASVRTPEEIYGIDNPDRRIFGDLILEAAEGIVPIRGLVGSNLYIPESDELVRGCHRPEGIHIISGKNVKKGSRLDADIADIAPTVYAVLGEAIPAGLDGQVMTEAFEKPLEVKTGEAAGKQAVKRVGQGPALQELSEEEEKLITKRLDDLGYLD